MSSFFGIRFGRARKTRLSRKRERLEKAGRFTERSSSFLRSCPFSANHGARKCGKVRYRAFAYVVPRNRARLASHSASRKVNAAVFQGMEAQLDDFGRPKVLPCVSTNELRDNLSQAINRAAFGREPVLVTRRGRKIAAIISIDDLVFLERMMQRKHEASKEKLPMDQSQIGLAMARSLYQELFFGWAGCH